MRIARLQMQAAHSRRAGRTHAGVASDDITVGMLGGFGGRDDPPIYKALYPRMVLRQGIECAWRNK